MDNGLISGNAVAMRNLIDGEIAKRELFKVLRVDQLERHKYGLNATSYDIKQIHVSVDYDSYKDQGWVSVKYKGTNYYADNLGDDPRILDLDTFSERYIVPIAKQLWEAENKRRMMSDIVLIRPIDGRLDQGLILVPEDEREKTRVGEVVDVGPGRKNPKTGKRMAIGVQKGDKVLYGHHTGEDLTMCLNGENLLAMREPDIMAVIE